MSIAAVVTAIATVVIALNSDQAKKPNQKEIEKVESKNTPSISSNKPLPAKATHQAEAKQDVENDENQPISPEKQITDLLVLRKFDEAITLAEKEIPHVAFRVKARIYLMTDRIELAHVQYDLRELKKNGYPRNISKEFYQDWNSLSIENDYIVIRNTDGEYLTKFKASEFVSNTDLSIPWTDDDMKSLRPALWNYEAKHPYCCLMKFLIDGYTPTDIEEVIKLDLLSGDYATANYRLNLLRLIDWEASWSEVEVLSVVSSAMQNEFKLARKFIYGEFMGHDALRYGKTLNAFIKMIGAYDLDEFDSCLQEFNAEFESYEVDDKFKQYDAWFEKPELEFWMSQLDATPKREALKTSWRALKRKHSMVDLYMYFYN